MHVDRPHTSRTGFRLLGAVVLVGVALSLPTQEAVAADVHALLKKSLTAEQRFSFQGTKLLIARDDDGQTFEGTTQVYHQAPSRTLMVGVGGDYESSRILIIGKSCYRRDDDGTFRVDPLPVTVARSEPLLLKNYTVIQQRVEMIARRKCVMVLLKPRHPGSSSKRVWLDVSNGMALKSQIWNWKGELTDESSFLSITFHAPLHAELFEVPSGARREDWPPREPDFRLLRVKQAGIPAGYRLIGNQSRLVPGRGVVCVQRFFDGLNTITLVQSRSRSGVTALGGRSAVSGKVGDVHFALFGEQKPQLLKKMSQAVSLS